MGKRKITAHLAEELGTIPETLYEMTGKKDGQFIDEEKLKELFAHYSHDEAEVRRDPIQDFQTWWVDHVKFVGKFRRLRRYRKRVLSRGQMVPIMLVKYRTPTGHERLMQEKTVATRMKVGLLPYYLLGKDLEEAGINLISEFPKAPTLETTCFVCDEPLFRRQGDLYSHLRDVLEAVLTGKVEPARVNFKRQHQECWQATKIRERIEGAEAEVIAELRMSGGKRNPVAEAQALAAEKIRLQKRVDGFLAHLRRIKVVPASRIQLFEQQFAAALEGIK